MLLADALESYHLGASIQYDSEHKNERQVELESVQESDERMHESERGGYSTSCSTQQRIWPHLKLPSF